MVPEENGEAKIDFPITVYHVLHAWILRGRERQEQLKVTNCRTSVQPDWRSR